MASAAVRPQQHQIQWLPLSWTLGFMTAYLGIVLFIAENVPENYMVSCQQATLRSTQITTNHATQQLSITLNCLLHTADCGGLVCVNACASHLLSRLFLTLLALSIIQASVFMPNLTASVGCTSQYTNSLPPHIAECCQHCQLSSHSNISMPFAAVFAG